jgi:hypothetical protein
MGNFDTETTRTTMLPAKARKRAARDEKLIALRVRWAQLSRIENGEIFDP